MKNNKISKKDSKEEFRLTKIFKNIYDAKYDLTQLQIMTVDGVIPFLDHEESRLLFFHNIPSVTFNNEREEKNIPEPLLLLKMNF